MPSGSKFYACTGTSLRASGPGEWAVDAGLVGNLEWPELLLQLWKAREFGYNTRFIELAGEINTSMPEYVVRRTADALNAQKKALNGSKVLILGLAYKPNVDDDRESPSYILLDMLKEKGAEVGYYDPYVPVIKPTREHPYWAGTKSATWDEETVGSFDPVLIATNHASVNYNELAAWSHCIVDTRNAMDGIGLKDDQLWKA